MKSPLPSGGTSPTIRPSEPWPVSRWRWATARLVLILERLSATLIRAACLILAFVVLALSGLPALLPPPAAWGLLLLTGGALVVLLWRGLRRFAWPDDRAVALRFEEEAGLSHHPLLGWADRPAIAGAPGLWEAHRAALRAMLAGLPLPRPRLALARHDPYALRILLLLAVLVGLVVERDDRAGERLAAALAPPLHWETLLPRPVIEAWATPPAYTGLAPIRLLPAGGEGIRPLPEGSRLVVTVGHVRGRPRIALGGHPLAVEGLDSHDFRSEAGLSASARLTIRAGWWYHFGLDLPVQPNQKPLLSFTAPPAADPRHPSLLRLAWKAEDQWGMRDLALSFVPLGHDGVPPTRVPLPLQGGRAMSGRAGVDLSANPWAGLPVRARLVGHDVAGLEGGSAEVTFILPERRFTHPLARLLIEARRVLIRDPAARAGALALLAQGAADPALFGRDYGGYLNYQAIAALLRRNPDPAAVGEAENRMWQLALHFEEGRRGEAARAVAEAGKALREAMERAGNGEKVDRATLERLAAELQAALESYLDALAREAKPAPPGETPDRVIDSRTLSALARRMQEDLAAGRLAQAREDMAALERELRALRNARRQAAEKEKEAARKAAEKEAEELRALARGEQSLLDHAERRLEARRETEEENWNGAQGFTPPSGMRPPLSLFFHPPPGEGERASPPQGGGGMEARTRPGKGAPDVVREADRKAQGALRQALGAFRKKVGPVGDEADQSFTEAEMAMRQAEAALAEGEDQAAATAETEALSALVQGGEAMAKARAEARGEGRGEDEDDEGEGSGGVESITRQGGGGSPDPAGWGQPSHLRRDPLGRAVQEGHGGADDASDVTVPDRFEATESRRIEEELRRREEDRTRPPEELHYIERLLDSF